MPQVPRIQTNLEMTELVELFAAGFARAYEREPTREEAGLLLALLGNEHAFGASMQNHNWGNLTTRDTAPPDFYRPPWFDADEVAAIEDPTKRARFERLHQRMLEGTAPSAFRSSSDHVAGAAEWFRQLRRNFSEVLRAAATGNATRFRDAIVSTSYCPDCSGVDYAAFRHPFLPMLERFTPARTASGGALFFSECSLSVLSGGS